MVQGDPAVITLTGFNFVRRSAVYFKSKPVPFRAVNSTELQVTLDAEALREAGRFDLVVKNPEPLDSFFVRSMWGNGTSNVAHLIVNYKYWDSFPVGRRTTDLKEGNMKNARKVSLGLATVAVAFRCFLITATLF